MKEDAPKLAGTVVMTILSAVTILFCLPFAFLSFIAYWMGWVHHRGIIDQMKIAAPFFIILLVVGSYLYSQMRPSRTSLLVAVLSCIATPLILLFFTSGRLSDILAG